jgi:hypothetical protein
MLMNDGREPVKLLLFNQLNREKYKSQFQLHFFRVRRRKCRDGARELIVTDIAVLLEWRNSDEPHFDEIRKVERWHSARQRVSMDISSSSEFGAQALTVFLILMD